MKFYQKVSDIFGTAQLQVEGFFTERVINLCKFQNIKIWNIQNITTGIVRFNISIRDIKKIKSIIKKTKCTMKIIKKRGMYFTAFKYRKRKVIIPLIIITIIALNVFNKMIWNIEIVGNEQISTEYILEKVKISGVHKGKFKSSVDSNYLTKLMKKEIPELAWVGVEYKGTTVFIKVVEKTTIPEEMVYDVNKKGDIVANKSGVITKIVAENGTCVHKVGSYVENGMVLIQGVIHSEILGDYKVRASGVVRMDVEYIFENEYKYEVPYKEYINKTKYTVGFSFNDKEICLNYLNKNKKYDTLKSGKSFNLFGNNISFDLYRFNEYSEKINTYTYDELVDIASNEADEYKNGLLKDTSNFVSQTEEVVKMPGGIKYKSVITINEEVGIFRGE